MVMHSWLGLEALLLFMLVAVLLGLRATPLFMHVGELMLALMATAVLPAAIRRANPAPDAQARSQGSVRTVRTFVLPSLAGTARGRSGDVI